MSSSEARRQEHAAEMARALCTPDHLRRLRQIDEAQKLLAQAAALLSGIDPKLVADLVPLCSDILSDARAISAERLEQECRL